ncbi:MAG: antitoxin VapB family protein [archaeon]
MARAIMVSDRIYGRLSKIKKGASRSFSEVLDGLLEKESDSSKTGGILGLYGSWKESPEDAKAAKEIKEAWKKWDRQYA